jgi:hypothetical protein
MSALIDRLAAWWTDRLYIHDLQRMEAEIMTYKLMKRLIENGIKSGTLDREATMLKLDVFLMADRITAEEYQELVELMGGTTNE